MIEYVELNNIQKHSNLRLNLSQVNCVYGESDTGKTAVMRGILWCLYGRGNAGFLLKNGEKECSVTVGIDGHTIKRFSGKENVYTLDGHDFKAFGKTIPLDILRCINSAETISVQARRDLPFMVCQKSTENAEQFSNMLDLSVIDVLVSNASKNVKECSSQVDAINEKLKEAENEQARYDNVDEATKCFSDMQLLSAKIEAKRSKRTALSALLEKAQSISSRYRSVANAGEARVALQAIEDKQKALSTLTARANALKRLMWTYHDVSKRITHENGADARKALTAISDLLESTLELRKKRQNYRTLYNNLAMETNATENAHSNLCKLQSYWDETVAGQICPTCGGIIGHENTCTR